jgi:hypothetical protein
MIAIIESRLGVDSNSEVCAVAGLAKTRHRKRGAVVLKNMFIPIPLFFMLIL